MVPALALTNDHYVKAMVRVGSGLHVDYFAEGENGEPTSEALKALDLWEMLSRDGWTQKQFDDRVHEFKKKNRWGTWTPADFINEVEPIQLEPYAWFLDQVDQDRTAAGRIDCYVAPDGSTGYGFKRDFAGILDPYRPVAALPAATAVAEEDDEKIDADIDEKIVLQRRIAKLEIQLKLARASSLARRVEKAESERDHLAAQVLDLEEARLGWANLAADLVAGTLTIEELAEMLGSEEESMIEEVA